MIKIFSTILISSIIALNLNANENEIKSYSLLKYQADFNKQTPQLQESITNEYLRVKKIATILQSQEMKNDVDLEVAKNIATLDLWTNKFMQFYKPSQEELTKLYEAEKPRVVAKYELRNILVSYEKNADRIITMLNEIKKLPERKDTFIKYVRSVSNDVASKQNDGLTALVDENKLNPEIKAALKDTKEGDIVKVNIKDIGTQILLVEKYMPEKEASFEESKDALENLAKRKALSKQMEIILRQK